MDRQETVTQQLAALLNRYHFNKGSLSRSLGLDEKGSERLAAGELGGKPQDTAGRYRIFNKILFLPSCAAEEPDRKLEAFLSVLLTYHPLSKEPVARMAGATTADLSADPKKRVDERVQYKVAVTVMGLRFFFKECEPERVYRKEEHAVRDSSMTEIIYDYYASRILFGYYVLGDPLPSSSYVCKQFQVCAPTVRTAFARLREEGFIKTTERKLATVVYSPDEQVERQYLQSFFARKEGLDDICRTAGLVFGPLAQAYFQQQDEASLKQIRAQLKKMQGHPAKQITLFYSEAMQPLHNALALNLYWEVVRYLRTPYLRRPANFDDTEVQAMGHVERMLALVEAGYSEQAAAEILAFSRDVMQSFWGRLPVAPDAGRPLKPVPFVWQIYREHPQLCYTLAAEIINRIDRGVYPQDELLPSCQALAQEYGVSRITMRRTLELLGDMRVTETYNGIGTKVVAEKNAGAPDFSHLQIRKSLLLFLQALQIGALTCKNIAVHTLSSLDDTGFQALDRKIQRHVEENKAFLLGETCLQFIGEKSPSAFIKEVYRQLCQPLLWGHCLHVFFQKNFDCDGDAARLQESLRRRDMQSFAGLLSELMTARMKRSRDLLLELGLEECKLIS